MPRLSLAGLLENGNAYKRQIPPLFSLLLVDIDFLLDHRGTEKTGGELDNYCELGLECRGVVDSY